MKDRNLFIEYTENRIELRKIKKEISFILKGTSEKWEDGVKDHPILQRLKEARQNWYDLGYGWNGWIACCQEFDITDGPEYEIAYLWDKKSEIIQIAGKIKKAIYNKGLKEIKRKNK